MRNVLPVVSEKLAKLEEKETLLLTVYGKALHSRSNNPVLHDQWAEEAVDHIVGSSV